MKRRIYLIVVVIAVLLGMQLYIKGRIQQRLNNGPKHIGPEYVGSTSLSDGIHNEIDGEGALKEQVEVKGGKIIAKRYFNPSGELTLEKRYSNDGRLIYYKEN